MLAMMLQRFDLVDRRSRLPARDQGDADHQAARACGSGRAPRQRVASIRPRARCRSRRQDCAEPPVAGVRAAASGDAAARALRHRTPARAEAFAERIASDAPAQGYARRASRRMDDHAGTAAARRAVVDRDRVVRRPAARQRPPVRRLARRRSRRARLTGVRYAVFGCGNRQWARTYQAVPKRVDAALEAAGATRVGARGEADAGGDFFGDFDDWYGGSGATSARRSASSVQAAPSRRASSRSSPSRPAATRCCGSSDLQHGEVVENRELVDMTAPLGALQAPPRDRAAGRA